MKDLIKKGMASGITSVPGTKAPEIPKPSNPHGVKLTKKHISWNKHDQEARVEFERIKSGEEEAIRTTMRIPEPHYAAFKLFLAQKRQPLQEYIWSLIMADMDQHTKAGTFMRPGQQNQIEE